MLKSKPLFELFCKADSDDCKKKRLSERGTPKVFGGTFLNGFLSDLEIIVCECAYVFLMNVAVFIDISNLERF